MAEPQADLTPVALAIGGNLGDRAATLREAVRRLVAGGVLVDAVSSLYETPPWGYEEQPKFLNGAVRGRTALSPRALLTLAKQIERDLGRVESFRNAPRPVDIDIALYGDHVIDEPDLQVPHPGLPERAFVLVPLAEIAGSWVHPPTGKTIAELRAALGHADEIAHFLGPARWAYITPEMVRSHAAPEIAVDSSTHPRYPARVLALHSDAELHSEIHRLGISGHAAASFPAHRGSVLLQVDQIPSGAAQEAARWIGEDAVWILAAESVAAMLITGTPAALQAAASSMEATRNQEVSAVGTAIRLVIPRHENPPATVRVGRHTFDWASGVQVMGILNATPDSFSDGGRYFRFDDAVRRAYEMAEQGATMIEVGGQSAQPGSVIPVEEELRRIVPLLKRLDREIGLPLAVDTFRVDVARGALEAGAVYINDISGGEDEGMARLAAETGVLLGIMHLRGRPKEKQWDTTYESVMDEVTCFLHERVGWAVRAGVRRENIVLDPGLGFGKEAPQDLDVMHRFSELRSFGLPILLATSRKNYLSDTMGLSVHDLIPETAAAVVYGIAQGANIIRVHDIDVMARIARFMPHLLRHSAG
jgi:dihydropteroate synthase